MVILKVGSIPEILIQDNETNVLNIKHKYLYSTADPDSKNIRYAMSDVSHIQSPRGETGARPSFPPGAKRVPSFQPWTTLFLFLFLLLFSSRSHQPHWNSRQSVVLTVTILWKTLAALPYPATGIMRSGFRARLHNHTSQEYP